MKITRLAPREIILGAARRPVRTIAVDDPSLRNAPRIAEDEPRHDERSDEDAP